MSNHKKPIDPNEINLSDPSLNFFFKKAVESVQRTDLSSPTCQQHQDHNSHSNTYDKEEEDNQPPRRPNIP